jgi:hypothetical protein
MGKEIENKDLNQPGYKVSESEKLYIRKILKKTLQ